MKKLLFIVTSITLVTQFAIATPLKWHDDPTINCLDDFNKVYDTNEFDFNTFEWKNPQAFQDYLDKAFNNPIDPEFKKKCLAKFIERQDIVYDKEKDHMTWKRVCDRFHPCKN